DEKAINEKRGTSKKPKCSGKRSRWSILIGNNNKALE
ncbi:MAG: hypothetical protein ACI9KM_000552, partial [Rubritalea sp.]